MCIFKKLCIFKCAKFGSAFLNKCAFLVRTCWSCIFQTTWYIDAHVARKVNFLISKYYSATAHSKPLLLGVPFVWRDLIIFDVNFERNKFFAKFSNQSLTETFKVCTKTSSLAHENTQPSENRKKWSSLRKKDSQVNI